MIVGVLPLRSKFGRISIHVYPGPWQLNSNPILFDYEYPYIILCFVIYFFKTTTKIYSTFIYEYDLEMP
jgi:hypothetical protein